MSTLKEQGIGSMKLSVICKCGKKAALTYDAETFEVEVVHEGEPCAHFAAVSESMTDELGLLLRSFQ